MAERIAIIDTPAHTGSEVTVSGWVDTKRDHGKISFVDLRDRSAKVQVVLVPASLDEESKELMKAIRPEWVIELRGLVKARPEKLVNKDLPTGTIEMEAYSIKVLNEAITPVIPLDQEKSEINEESRLQYRYLDLRRESMLANLQARHKTIKFIRDFLDARGFWEVETPYMTKSTPEGARDFVIPSRKQPGTFYALPQSPQQYKQLLMTSGVEKYFQVARCFRDEDTRKDRQPEFTQLDLEMSFVEEEDVMSLNEQMLIELVQTYFPEKKIQQIPFPRISYAEAMEKYGSDRPDLREDKDDSNLLAFCWVVDFPQFEKTEEGTWTFSHNPFSAPKPEYLQDLMNENNIGEILAAQYDIALNGFEIGGGSIRNHQVAPLKKVLEIIGFTEESAEEAFGHMFAAFESGTPPHGGIAWGLDRLVAILQAEDNIREVMAFPKTGDGRDPMMVSPSAISTDQLMELGIKVQPIDKK